MMIDRIHERFLPSRFARLAELIVPLLPPSGVVLDVGAGSGVIARQIMDRCPGLRIEGIDVLIRSDTAIPVKQFDGHRIPYPDKSVDAVLLVDVLHHLNHQVALLREACRVSRGPVIVKDHLREGWLARPTLALMDWVGNRRYGVALPGTYWSQAEWNRALAEVGLVPERWQVDVRLYPWPLTLLFDRSLHVLARLVPAAATEVAPSQAWSEGARNL